MGDIFNSVVTWSRSFVGMVTILLVIITASRLIMSGIREKHDKESSFYKNTKTLMCLFYAVVIINWAGAMIGNMKSSLFQTGHTIAGITWAAVGAILVFFIVAIGLSFRRDNPIFVWIGGAITFCSTGAIAFAKLDNGDNGSGAAPILTMLAAIAVIITGVFVHTTIEENRCVADQEAAKAAEAQNSESQESDSIHSHKSLLLALLWIASVVAAYLAGEYSLVPKLVAFLQGQAAKRGRKKERGENVVEGNERTEMV